MELKKINVGSAAKVGGVISAVLGLIIGIIVALFSMMIPGGGSEWPFFSGFAAIIILPIIYGIIGFIAYAIIAALYNFVVGFTGGIILEFSDKGGTE
jgi:hypothetical protein